MKRFSALLVASLLAISCTAHQPIRTLIVTGQNNHNWPVSSVMLDRILTNSGLFRVETATTPPAGGEMELFAPDFTQYDLVVLDYNGDRWSPQTDEAFLRFVERGGGVVVYHAADNAFGDWPEFNRIIALGGWGGRNEQSGPHWYWQEGRLMQDLSPGYGGSHGNAHAYALNCRDADHPITRGLPAVWMHDVDELYDRMRGPGNIASLLYTAYSDPATRGSGYEEPMIFTVEYGAGRIFHTMIGHVEATAEESSAIRCTGFQTLLLRGAEWAATGEVTQPVPADFPTAEAVSTRPELRAPAQ